MSDTPTEPTEGSQEAADASPATFTIHAPNRDYTGLNGSVEFRNGKGVTDNPRLADRFRRKGYTVTEGGTLPGPGVPASIQPSTLQQAQPSRDAAIEGSSAAGPASDAFLAPMGAGEGKDPHGPEVVSPGIHALPPGPLVPGEVPRDAEAQETKETEAAQKVLIEGEPNVAGPDWQEPTGPINMSDPGSEGKGPDASALPERPANNASKDAWVAYAVTQGVPREEAENLSRGGLIERVGG